MSAYTLGRSLLAAVVLATVAMPYASPLHCDVAQNEAAITARPGTAENVASSPADRGTAGCHGSRDCSVALVAIVLEIDGQLPAMPTHAEPNLLPRQRLLQHLFQPLLPPPRV